jgi:hypothetical protein
MIKSDDTKSQLGRCHCGEVRYEVRLDLSAGGSRCNCSLCTRLSQLSAIVKPEAFTLLSGEESLGEYRWGGRTAGFHFCKRCGVYTFGRGHLAELGGDYCSVNLNCLEDVDPATLPVVYWDGRHDNWDAGPRSTPWPVHQPAARRVG